MQCFCGPIRQHVVNKKEKTIRNNQSLVKKKFSKDKSCIVFCDFFKILSEGFDKVNLWNQGLQ